MRVLSPRSIRRAVRRAFLAIPIALAPALGACAGSGEAAEPDPPRQEEFVGTIVYEVGLAGTNPQGEELFRAFGPSREVVTWGSGGRLRLETTGGLYAGIIVARMAADSAIFSLDSATRVATPARVTSMNMEDIEPEMRARVEARIGPAQMQRTEEEGEFAGRRCRMYTMLRSGMLRRGATARACLAEDLRPRSTRYQFHVPGDMGQMSPLPLQYGIREGLPLMVEVTEDSTVVTYRAVTLTPGEPADSLFSVPAGYTVAEPGAGG